MNASATALPALLLLLLRAAGVGAAGNRTRYGFYRAAEAGGRRAGDGRRLFGGRSAALEPWGAVCSLLDRYWGVRCSASVLAPRWALTAGHCVSPRIAYVKYNARRPAAPEGDAQPVLYLYRHPGYEVVQEGGGRGADVTMLHHDLGLVRTRGDMRLTRRPALAPLRGLAPLDAQRMLAEEVEVLGFGRTERSSLGEELVSARLWLVPCERSAWFHCACGEARGAAAGVCAGDSGGPVLYRGAQVAVTSMGPLECAAGGRGDGDGEGDEGAGGRATSVFTVLSHYAQLINSTVRSADAALHMERLSRAPRLAPPLVFVFALSLSLSLSLALTSMMQVCAR